MQLVAHEQRRTKLREEYHDAPTATYYDVEKTIVKIAHRYYWTGMRRLVTEYIRKCVDCQIHKSSNPKPAGLFQTPIQSQRFDTMAVELFGPLPMT